MSKIIFKEKMKLKDFLFDISVSSNSCVAFSSCWVAWDGLSYGDLN